MLRIPSRLVPIGVGLALLTLTGCSGPISITSANAAESSRLAACASLFGDEDWTSTADADGFSCFSYAYGPCFSVSVSEKHASNGQVLGGRNGVSIYFDRAEDEATARQALARLDA